MEATDADRDIQAADRILPVESVGSAFSHRRSGGGEVGDGESQEDRERGLK